MNINTVGFYPQIEKSQNQQTILLAPVNKRVKTESMRKLSNFNFQWTKTLYHNNLNNIAFLFTFFRGHKYNIYIRLCMFKLTRVNRIKHLVDKKTLIYLINAFVFSKLFYCSTVWSSTSKKNVRKLQLVQNYACRIVAGLRKYASRRIPGPLRSTKNFPSG